MKKKERMLSGLIFVFIGLVLLEMIAIIVTSILHQTIMACISYFMSVVAMLYIFYLLLNKPLELAESDTNLCYISQREMKYCTIYKSFDTVPDNVKEGGYTFFCRGNGEDFHHVYMYSPENAFPVALYLFSKYYCKLPSDGGEQKWILIYSKSNGLDKTGENVRKSVLFGTVFAIVAGIAVLFYTNVKYQPEFRNFYEKHSVYHPEIDSSVTNSKETLYNFHSADNPEEVQRHFRDCDFTLVLCEDNQGGYLFAKCICVNRSKYSVDIVNFNPYVAMGEENFQTKLNCLGNDYQSVLTLTEDTFKMHFNHFVVLKYDGFSALLNESTLTFTPQESFLQAVSREPAQASSMEQAMSNFYVSAGLATEGMTYSYSDYVAQIMSVEHSYLDYLRKSGKYPQTMETLLYQMENDFLLSVLQNIAEQHFPKNTDVKCLETNLSWDSVENLLMLSTYKHKSLYHSYYDDKNTVSIPYTSQCMWYEHDNAFYVYTSQNDIDSLSIQWLYYTIGR